MATKPVPATPESARHAVRDRGNSELRAIGFGAAATAAALAYVFAPAWITGTARFVAGYDVGAVAMLALTWRLSMHHDPERTKWRAAQSDPGRNVVFLIVILAGIVGFGAAISIPGLGSHVHDESEHTVAVALAVVAIVAGWLLVHTTFTFRYAHLYYFDADGDEKADGGLNFPGTETPSDYDFAYFSFVIGMTFQVSDVSISSPNLRRLALGHALISFAYSTAIIALVVNIASGLFH